MLLRKKIMQQSSPMFTLRNRIKIPSLGFGTWQAEEGDSAVNAVKKALETGYRHIDTAAIYGNEVSVGKAIAQSGIDRSELFVTSKLWNSDRGYIETMRAFEKSMENLQLDYLDLYLIHWPASHSRFSDWDTINRITWQAMIDLHLQDRIKAIGVSNFLPHHITALRGAEVKPLVNQIEFHPGHTQAETVQYCKENDILVQAWSPLGKGRVLSDERLVGIAQKYEKSVAQLCIRWCLQQDIVPLPKSVTPSRIEENFAVFDFTISPEDMDAISTLPEFGASGLHPDQVEF
jgi:diketogulonate reductase-like aldo/keto reductase